MKSLDVSEPSFIPSFLASVVLHLLVVAVIFLLAKPKPLPEVASIQASLVGAGDLAGIEGQIAKAHAQHQAKNQITTITAPPPKTAYQDDIALKEAQYQAQLKAYASALDQDFASEMRAYQESLDQADRERQREVQELERRERSNDEIARQNAKELQKAHESAKQNAKRQNQSQDSADDDSPTPHTVGQGQSHSGTGGSSTNAGSSGNSSATNIVGALQAHIKRHWQPTGTGASLKVRLSVDGDGNVLSVSVSGGTPHLQSALEDTIRRASPLTPVQGTSYRNLNFDFHIN